MIQWIETFIIMNPLGSAMFLIFVCTWLGSYLESIFKFWDWGPECEICKEYHFYTDCIIHCKKCNDTIVNDTWEDGYVHGERVGGGLK